MSCLRRKVKPRLGRFLNRPRKREAWEEGSSQIMLSLVGIDPQKSSSLKNNMGQLWTSGESGASSLNCYRKRKSIRMIPTP